MDYVGLYALEALLYLNVAYRVVQRMYGATHFVNYDNSVFLAQCLLEKLAFRTEGGASDERYIVAPLG